MIYTNTNNLNLGSCSPTQIISLTYAINDLSSLHIFNGDSEYDCLQYSYSLDGVCWTNYSFKKDLICILEDVKQDYYIRAKVNGLVTKVVQNCEDVPYTTTLDSGFNFGSGCENNQNLYSPYSGIDTAIALQQQQAENVACMFGIPIYYFKVNPNADSKDITFKEYCLMNVTAVKQIKLVIADGMMPSSKPEFTEFGIDFQTDWETEITKQMFATAFGVNAQPMEGDIIYIPMMKRMWMVNSAYEEKKDAFMWNAVSWKVALVKYQEKDSVDLGSQEELVNSLVTNTYEELFGVDENIDSSEAVLETPRYQANNLYNVFMSDAVRKYASVDNIDFKQESLNQKSTRIADNLYVFNSKDASIIYQHQYCGEEGSLSFCIKGICIDDKFEGTLVTVGNIMINIYQSKTELKLRVENVPSLELKLNNNEMYFVYLRWSRKMNIIEFNASKYTYPQKMPIYRLQPFHYYFDIDNPIQVVSKFDVEMIQENKCDVGIHNFIGFITNFKLFNIYIDQTAELLQQLPNNKHLIINDPARKFVDTHGKYEETHTH